jgi:hypothetical protein
MANCTTPLRAAANGSTRDLKTLDEPTAAGRLGDAAP